MPAPEGEGYEIGRNELLDDSVAIRNETGNARPRGGGFL